MKNLKRIFYIYSEASSAVFFSFGCIAELICLSYFSNVGVTFMQVFTGIPAVCFALVVFFNIRYIIKQESK